MAWDELHAEVIEEFGLHARSLADGEENLWLAQASARREYERGRAAGIARDKAAAGECLDCADPAVPGRKRCAYHLAVRSARSGAYVRRLAEAPISEVARVAIAASRAHRERDRRHGGLAIRLVPMDHPPR